jgi:hypothetical protein
LPAVAAVVVIVLVVAQEVAVVQVVTGLLQAFLLPLVLQLL